MIKFKNINGLSYLAVGIIKRKSTLNGEKSLTGTLYSGDKVLNSIDKGWSLEFEDEPYVVTYYKRNDSDNSVEFDAIHKFFWDMSKSVIYKSTSGSATIKTYLDSIFSDSGYRYSLNFSPNAIQKDNWGMKNRLSLFNDIISSIDAEFEINGTLISIFKKIGTDLSTIVRYGFNLSDMSIENDASRFVTYGEGFGALIDKDKQDGPRLHVTYESPLAKVYGRLQAEPIEDERYTIEDNLLNAVKAKVDNSFSVSVNLSLYDLKAAGYPYKMANVGDWLMAIDESVNFSQRVRIISIDDEFAADGTRISYSVTAGDVGIVQRYQEANATVQSKLNNAIDSANQALSTANYAQISADGKNTIYRLNSINNLPETANEGDLAFVQKGDGTLMYVYTKKTDGSFYWEKRIDPEMGEQIADGVDDAVNKAKTYSDTISKEIDARLEGKADMATINLLKDDINLSVKKGDVINQINIDTSGTLVKSDKIILDGNTTVTGNFYAKGGNFKNLNASNITGGTINAANVNLINLNANSVTAGAINGANLKINLDTGWMEFARGRIKSLNENLDINIDDSYIAVKDWKGQALLRSGGFYLTQQNIFDANANEAYFSIENNISSVALSNTAKLKGRDMIVITTRDNDKDMFTIPIDQELFAGLSAGRDGNEWLPTKVGGASRGVIISGGKKFGSFMANSPYIVVGDTSTAQSSSFYGTRITLAGEYVQIPSAYYQTNSTPANLAITSTGALVRTTSASKYKTSIHHSDDTHMGNKLLNIQPATWYDKATIRRFKTDENEQKPHVEFGMIAEDLAREGLDWLVIRDPKGEIEGIKYDRLVVSLLPVIKEMKNEIVDLKEQLNAK